ncbi:MAG: hypothetical protein CMK89_17175 [Pseudomonadales bacterium]|nr:hypothetical protein [Pseudomonadales bacterium]
MWMWVSGVAIGIIFSVLVLPALTEPFPTTLLVFAALFPVVTGLSWSRLKPGPYRVTLVVMLASLVGLAIGGWVKYRLSPWELETGSTYYLSGEVTGIPRANRFSTGYRLKADCLGRTQTDCSVFHNRIPVLWPVLVEVSSSQRKPVLIPGQRVQIQVQNRVSRVNTNPGAFNVERWLLSSHIVARLKLKRGSTIQQSGKAWFTMDRVRARLNAYFSQSRDSGSADNLSAYPVILALLSGDRSLMTDQHWALFNRTGTTHLVAISGLHVGLVATMVTLLAMPLFRRWRWFTNRYPASHGALVLAWLASLVYCGLAGFAIPTQRALIMLSVYVALKLTGRAQHLWFGLLVALCIVLVWDPVACLSLGFWLSFSAVYLILWLIGGNVSARSKISQWTTVQLGLFIGLAPALLWSVHSVSLVSAFTNAVAIPLIGFVVVPLALVWCALWAILGEQVASLLAGIVYLTDSLLWLLHQFSSWRYSTWSVGERSMASLLLAMVGVLWLVSAGLPGRAWGMVLLLPILLPQVQGKGLYIMGAGSGRILFQSEHAVWSLSKSHWPEPVAHWQAQLLTHWGVMIPPESLTLHATKQLWLAPEKVLSEFNLHKNFLGARHLGTASYSHLCDRPHWQTAAVKFTRYEVEGRQERCALAMEWGQSRWLYWPLDTIRDQAAVLSDMATERFDVLLLDVGKGKPVEPALLSLLVPDGKVISIKPLSEAMSRRVADLAIPVHVIEEEGYYYQPFTDGAD